jgi:hypothetical protein
MSTATGMTAAAVKTATAMRRGSRMSSAKATARRPAAVSDRTAVGHCSTVRYCATAISRAATIGITSARHAHATTAGIARTSYSAAAIAESGSAIVRTVKAVSAPTMRIAPVCPRAHAQEDAVIEVSWPVETVGCACVRGVVVVAPLANRWSAQVDAH